MIVTSINSRSLFFSRLYIFQMLRNITTDQFYPSQIKSYIEQGLSYTILLVIFLSKRVSFYTVVNGEELYKMYFSTICLDIIHKLSKKKLKVSQQQYRSLKITYSSPNVCTYNLLSCLCMCKSVYVDFTYTLSS